MNLPDGKDNQKFLQRYAAQMLTEEQIKTLAPYQRQALGLDPLKKNIAQRFIESTPMLKQWGLLRRTFGLDKALEPSMPFGTEEWLGGETYSWYNAQLAFELDRRCFSGDTEVLLLDGEIAEMRDLWERWEKDQKTFYVYSYDRKQKKLVPGKVTKVWNNGVKKMLRVILDDGTAVRCTPEHRWMLLDGQYVSAKALRPGDSLMPLYWYFDGEYERVKAGGLGRATATHRMVSEGVEGAIPKGWHVHHKDGNRGNNSPENLGRMSRSEHMKHHMSEKWANPDFRQEAEKRRTKLFQDSEFVARFHEGGRKAAAKNWQDPEYRKKMSEVSSKSLKERWQDPEYREGQLAALRTNVFSRDDVCVEVIAACAARGLSIKEACEELECGRQTIHNRLNAAGIKFSELKVNHKVAVVLDDGGEEEAFDLSVEKYHNFSIHCPLSDSGVIVHNSVYTLVEEMDTYDLLTASLDVYSEEATQLDPDTNRTVWIESKSEKVKVSLMKMLDRVGIEESAFSIVRAMCKYGDDFERVVVDEKDGVVALDFIRPERISRVDDKFGKLKGFVPGLLPVDMQAKPYEELDSDIVDHISRPWDFLHFRLVSSRRDSKHGESMILGTRRAWRQLKIMEDSIVLYRINRAPDRVVYYIDTDTQTPDQQWQTVTRWRQALKKKFYYNTDTGSLRQEYNPYAVDDEIFWPRGKDNQSSIDILSGSANADEIHDVEHFLRKFFAATAIPKAIMGYEGDINSKATLAQQDVRFARKIKRVQRAFRLGIAQLCRIHLAVTGIDAEDADNAFQVKTTPISYLDDLQRSELYSLRIETVRNLSDLKDSLNIKNATAWSEMLMVKFLGLPLREAKLYTSPDPANPEQDGDDDDGASSGRKKPGFFGASDNPPEDDYSTKTLKEYEKKASRLLPNLHGGVEDGILEEGSEFETPNLEDFKDPEKAGRGLFEDYDLEEELAALSETLKQSKTLSCPNPSCLTEDVSISPALVDGDTGLYLVCNECDMVAEFEDITTKPKRQQFKHR